MSDDEILDDLIRREGGFVNHPADRGGPTKYGITQATLARWRGRAVSAADVRTLTRLEARQIFEAQYLKPWRDTPSAIKPQLVDMTVLHGLRNARRIAAQASAQTNVDLAKARMRFMARIVQRDPTQRVFLLGWLNRAMEFI